MPAGRGLMLFDRILPASVVVTNAGGYFCTHNSLNLTATVNVSTATGTVSFYAWTDNVSSTFIGIGTVTSGNASYNMTGGTLSAGNYYLQAVYSGDSNFKPSSSPSGTAGVLIEGISADVTSVTTPVLSEYTPSGSYPGFCENNSITLTSSVSSTHLPTPFEGTVNFIGTYAGRGGSPTVVNLGSVTPTAGFAPLVIANPLAAFEGIDQVDWVITTTYTGDSCYANSGPSAGLTVFPTLNQIDIAITSGSTNFCYTSAETYVVNVSSPVSGTAGGNLQLFLWYTPSGGTQQSQLLYNTNLSGSVGGSGFNTSIPFSSGAFEVVSGLDGAVGDVYLQAIWDPNAESCYSGQNSDIYVINVTSSATQSPTLTLTYSLVSSSGPFDNGATGTLNYGNDIWFKATFEKGGGPGSLTGADVIINASPGGFSSSPYAVTDGGNTFSVVCALPEGDIGGTAGGTFLVSANSESTSCWNDGNSNSFNIAFPPEPPH